MKKVLIILIIIVVGIVVLVITRGQDGNNQDEAGTSSFDKVPDFSLEDYDGNIVSLADFSGKPLVLNSWAVWCPFCVDELPDFVTIQKEFGEVTIIAIDRAESLNTTKEFTDELGVTDDLIFLLDPKDSFYQSIGGFAMPETLFVDKNGNVIEHKRGPLSEDQIRQRVQNLLDT